MTGVLDNKMEEKESDATNREGQENVASESWADHSGSLPVIGQIRKDDYQRTVPRLCKEDKVGFVDL